MLIVGNFRDFYDVAAKYGVDKTCVYRRTETILKGTFQFSTGRRWNRDWPYEEEFRKTKSGTEYRYVVGKYVVGFCGHLYPLILIEKSSEKEKTQNFCFYSADKVWEFFEKEEVDFDEQNYYSHRNFSVTDSKSFIEFFNSTEFEPLKKEFQKNRCPVFVYGRFPVEKGNRKAKLVLNPRLKDYRFFQIKDPQTAFQDVFMFISGVLGIDAPDMVELSDKEMAKKRGHDGKYSFKRVPGEKRGKRK